MFFVSFVILLYIAREALTPTLNRNSDEYTIVYTPSSAPNRGAAIQLVFWQADAGHVLVRSLPLGDELLAMASHGAHCVVATSRRTKSDAVEYVFAKYFFKKILFFFYFKQNNFFKKIIS